MKKIYILIISVFLLTVSSKMIAPTRSANFDDFEEMSSSPGLLLAEMDQKFINEQMQKTVKLRYTGWNYQYLNRDFLIKFKSRTIFSYYNDGYTPIEYKYKAESKLSTKLHISSMGQIKIDFSLKQSKFSGGLSQTLKLERKYEEAKEYKETIDIKLLVDPGTQVDLFLLGSGKASNGVGSRYSIFSRKETGAFEYVLITNQYYRLEKKKI